MSKRKKAKKVDVTALVGRLGPATNLRPGGPHRNPKHDLPRAHYRKEALADGW